MPRAGFYAIHNASIRFGRDGRWYADGQPITNPRIARLFARSVHRCADGSYELRVAEERAAISVDDTPYVVTAASTDAAGTVWVELNDETREALAADTLSAGADDVLYCRVKGGREWARFLRPAYYQLADRLVDDGNGGVAFATPTGRHPIGRRQP
jgi:hypothetical protein